MGVRKMNNKMLILLLATMCIFAAGCIGDSGDDVDGGEANVSDDVISGDIPDEDISENVSEDISENVSEEIIEPRTYSIRLDHFLSRPSPLEINKGDTVYWNNRQNGDDRKQFTLVSEDGLWDNHVINYGIAFNYTFTEEGTYNYSILGRPTMDGTVIVK
jgi:plastocyanin